MRMRATLLDSRLHWIGLAALCVWACEPEVAVEPVSPEPAESRAAPLGTEVDAGTNRLAGEASPYLQLHAHNPVDWYPWGEEAFAKARDEDKPIFLSVGYSTCYWCHVMEREVFANAEIAALMNETVVSIKVDREERPDIDEVYMTATQLLTGSGGWPNSVFLTPERKPFYAGTYFPPQDRRGRIGFPKLLRRIAAAWEQDRESVVQTAEQVALRISGGLPRSAGSVEMPTPDALLARVTEELRRRYEVKHGGFSRSTKFPRPPLLELILVAQLRKPDPEVLAMLTHTLDEMALGGIYDHVGGGFHRYSTEGTWSIPHFEKMLYDNGQLVGLYARAYAATGRELYRSVVEQTLAYLAREMRLPGGGLASAQDAEVAGEEGASYVWSRGEIEAALGEKRAERFLSVYELVALEGGEKGVLRVRLSAASEPGRFAATGVAELLGRFASDRAKLLEVRQRRPQPLRDDKVLVAWNALGIAGLVQAAVALERPAPLRRAEETARFVLLHLRSADGGLHRSSIGGQVRERGVLEDYALLADALLALEGATGDEAWGREARAVADAMLTRFADPGLGGLFETQADTELFARLKSFEDSVLPSSNGVALRVLLQLSRGPRAQGYRAEAGRTLAAFAPLLERAPTLVASASVERLRSEGLVQEVLSQSSEVSQRKPASGGLPRSEDHVRVSAFRGAGGQLRVRVAVDAGWHVNANPASLAYLIPTRVEREDGAALRGAHYPQGTLFQPEFAPEPISVYEGSVEIPLTRLEGESEISSLVVRYQACDERQCLPPARSPVALPARLDPASGPRDARLGGASDEH
ncbi:MAG: DUF255 domain-containing protein [Deltaproteobacteria bacterium]|nr:DUF255 domain-containing protein [Deltaproteobacteria bacterium]